MSRLPVLMLHLAGPGRLQPPLEGAQLVCRARRCMRQGPLGARRCLARQPQPVPCLQHSPPLSAPCFPPPALVCPRCGTFVPTVLAP